MTRWVGRDAESECPYLCLTSLLTNSRIEKRLYGMGWSKKDLGDFIFDANWRKLVDLPKHLTENGKHS
jgi:hypothetical protein